MAALSRRFVIAGLATALVSPLAACGRRADLDTPYQAAVEARREAAENDEPLPPEPERPDLDRPFVLDAIIE